MDQKVYYIYGFSFHKFFFFWILFILLYFYCIFKSHDLRLGSFFFYTVVIFISFSIIYSKTYFFLLLS